jgi:hypothetical protein
MSDFGSKLRNQNDRYGRNSADGPDPRPGRKVLWRRRGGFYQDLL